jgi:hypothetical protein
MKVPFRKLAPGQSGRVALRVTGIKGVVLKPQRIQYVDLEDAVLDKLLPTPADGPLAVAGLNLLALAGQVALSAATYNAVQELHAKADAALISLERLEQKVDAVLERVKRIDLRSAEATLREALRHAFQHGIREDEIDVVRFAPLVDDIDAFLEPLEDGPELNWSVRLTSDVRDRLSALLSLLVRLRTLIATRHNRACAGDPSRVVAVRPMSDYMDVDKLAGPLNLTLAFSLGVANLRIQLESDLGERFAFANDDDRAHFDSLIEKTCLEPLENLEDDHLGRAAIALMSLLDETIIDKSPEQRQTTIRQLILHWLFQTDAGLLHRVREELRAVRDGYDQVFWNVSDLGGAADPELLVSATLQL